MFIKMELGKAYFYTASIYKWQKLLVPDRFKEIVLGSLCKLVNEEKIFLYGFVIMPNHIHLIWEMRRMNGKEMPHASFMKFTGHRFQAELRANHLQVLPFFYVGKPSRQYQFWQRNSLPIELYSPAVWEQKLNYVHLNPLQAHWGLATRPADYRYSSAKFYEEGIDDFDCLTHWRDRY
jgi:REP element-mobilizing transposase RayT